MRIIALYGAINEILIALGAQDSIAARTRADADLEPIKHLPSIGTHMQPNPELIMAQNPDLIIQLKGRSESLRNLDFFRERNIPVLVFQIDTFEDLFSMTEKLGKILNREDRAGELIAEWKNRLKILSDRKHQYRPKVFYEARYPNLLAAGSKGIINEIIKLAGGDNIIDIPKKLVRINEEVLFIRDPDVYIIQKGPMNPDGGNLTQRKNLDKLRAAKMVLVVDEGKFARPGPQSIDAAEQLNSFLFPNRENK